MILSGEMMFDYLGWTDAANLVRDAVEATIAAGEVTYDLERNLEDAKKLGTSEFAEAVIQRIEELA